MALVFAAAGVAACSSRHSLFAGGAARSPAHRGPASPRRAAPAEVKESALAEVLLRRVENGSLADASAAPMAAKELWREKGAVVHVVRRAG